MVPGTVMIDACKKSEEVGEGVEEIVVPDEDDRLGFLRIKLSSEEDPDDIEIGQYNHYTLPNPAAELTINPKSQSVAINQYMLVSGDNQMDQCIMPVARVCLTYSEFYTLCQIRDDLKDHVTKMAQSVEQVGKRILTLAGQTLSHMIFTRVGPFNGVNDKKTPIFREFLSAYAEFMAMNYNLNLVRALSKEIKEDKFAHYPPGDLLNLVNVILMQTDQLYSSRYLNKMHAYHLDIVPS